MNFMVKREGHMTDGLMVLLIILSIGSLFIGATDIEPGMLVSGKDPMALRIFLSGRVPRLLAILCTGVGMSVAGLIMQQLCMNKFVSPSKIESAIDIYNTKLIANFAERMQIRAVDGKDNTIGNFIHHVMCLWNGDKRIIDVLAKAYGVRVVVDALATSIAKFWSWMEKTYGKATQVDREFPFSFVNESGQVVTGEIDLVYRTAEGDVLVDYKTYQGSPAHLTDENSNFFAGKYCGQISLYEDALKRTDIVIRDRLICYLSLGTIIRMK